MRPMSQARPRRLAFVVAGWLLCGPVLGAGTAEADPYRLAPNTKVAIAVVQWNPTKGAYERWEALGGTFVVSQDGLLSLPILGSVHVSDQTAPEVATALAASLTEQVGLLSPPDVSIEVEEYPPVYVVGEVNEPNSYEFRPGLTVLQALARAGGRYRQTVPLGGQDSISLAGELETLETDILRSVGRIARLEAEQAGQDSIDFPPEVLSQPNSGLANEILLLERTVFSARTSETKRQLASLSELRNLYALEISTLKAKADAADHSIAVVTEELEGVTKLLERGIATLSRKSDLERTLADLQVARLDVDTEMMRVQQSLSAAKRQELNIQDERQTALALELRDAQADLDRLRSRKETLVRLLSNSGLEVPSDRESETELTYTIVRQTEGDARTFSASTSTALMPGDVLRVDLVERDGGADSPADEVGVSQLPPNPSLQDLQDLALASPDARYRISGDEPAAPAR
jgi:protein involved in polysaccharide export with SLBB domain